jgi:hypothetical protein
LPILALHFDAAAYAGTVVAGRCEAPSPRDGFIKSGFDGDKFAELGPAEDAAERLK